MSSLPLLRQGIGENAFQFLNLFCALMPPPRTPDAVNWRAELSALILAHGLANVLDALSAFAELRARRAEGQTGLFDKMEARDIAAPARRRISRKTERLRAEARADGRGRIVA